MGLELIICGVSTVVYYKFIRIVLAMYGYQVHGWVLYPQGVRYVDMGLVGTW